MGGGVAGGSVRCQEVGRVGAPLSVAGVGQGVGRGVRAVSRGGESKGPSLAVAGDGQGVGAQRAHGRRVCGAACDSQRPRGRCRRQEAAHPSASSGGGVEKSPLLPDSTPRTEAVWLGEGEAKASHPKRPPSLYSASPLVAFSTNGLATANEPHGQRGSGNGGLAGLLCNGGNAKRPCAHSPHWEHALARSRRRFHAHLGRRRRRGF